MSVSSSHIARFISHAFIISQDRILLFGCIELFLAMHIYLHLQVSVCYYLLLMPKHFLPKGCHVSAGAYTKPCAILHAHTGVCSRYSCSNIKSYRSVHKN